MSRKILYIFFFLAAWISPAISQDFLKFKEIPRVMERLFHFHIENKQLTPSLIRRSIKLYIEQFDADKAYLIEDEISKYLDMNDLFAKEIYHRVKENNYADFIALNSIFEKAILRAQNVRRLIAAQMPEILEKEIFTASFVRYPQSESEVMERQKNRMARFYLFHQSRAALDSLDRKKSVYALFERKINRLEGNYLFLDRNGTSFSKNQIEHLLTLRILKSFAKGLDTHTAFFSPEEAYEMRLSLEKQFEGVGIVLSEGIDGVMITNLIEGSPAEQSGQIQVNDLLVEIDGKSVSSEIFEDVLDLLKKKDRSEIILGFKRFDPVFKQETFFQVVLKKRPISMKDEGIKASYETISNGIIGKIALYSFYESSDGISSEKDIKEAIRRFRQKGELKGLVLDLRENSGGFLGQAVRVAGLFVSNGVIVVSKYGNGDVHYLRNIVGKKYFDGPLVVLTSKMSASASEIVAQALQDYGVALIVGDERTFGKGSIQYQTITDESADLFFKVTVGRYYTVSGRSTQIEGVLADIVVPTQYAPYQIGERYLEYPLYPDRVEAVYSDPLADLDHKTKLLFERRYLPYLQKVVSIWRDHLPFLKKNSAKRIAESREFQRFLEKVEKVRIASSMVNSIGEQINGFEDLQMKEAINIVKDMLHIQKSNEEMAISAPTGTEDL